MQVLCDHNANTCKSGFGISTWTLHIGDLRLKSLCPNQVHCYVEVRFTTGLHRFKYGIDRLLDEPV
jgi:hypothetical protein